MARSMSHLESEDFIFTLEDAGGNGSPSEKHLAQLLETLMSLMHYNQKFAWLKQNESITSMKHRQ